MSEFVKIINSKLLFKNTNIKASDDFIELPNSIKTNYFHLDHPKVCVILPLHKKKITMVNQLRYGPNKYLWELPAGKAKKNEDLIQCAKRELLEEADLKAENLEKIHHFYTSPHFSNEQVHCYVATKIKYEKGKKDYDEIITKKEFNLIEIKKMIRTNIIQDSKSLVCLLKFFENQKTTT